MPTILVIGIGAGNPDHLTLQATKSIARADVFFVSEQASAGTDLAHVRKQMIADHARPASRTVDLLDPRRDRDDPNYEGAVERWRQARVDLWRTHIEALGDEETGAFLVWGDPALYDSTLWVLDRIDGITVEVIPGVSAISALAAAHGIPWNRVAGDVVITTGRRYSNGEHRDATDVLVMLDASHAFTTAPDDTEIFWGAYLGTADEILVAGPVRDVEASIRKSRAEARSRIGWIMDSYLLRRTR